MTPVSSLASEPGITLSRGADGAVLVVDTNDFPVVQVAAHFFADDVQRVTGSRLAVSNALGSAHEMIIAGTMGHSDLIDRLIAENRLKRIEDIRGRWENTLIQTVDNPFPNVQRALVIVGSDRRGTAYGLMQLSEKIGVSPWYWWADVPVKHQDSLKLNFPDPQLDAPGVKFRGIFINDEDWGINQWASHTFDPDLKNIGPKTYEKVYELMLRLRLNYIWPAMHPCTTEFGSIPENATLADKFGIVAGSSHCEPMLCNNVHWKEAVKGKWNYSLNRDVIHSYWEENVKARHSEEAVWTLGIRGIHDAGMETPPGDLPGKISLMTQVIHDQRELIDQNVTKQWGPVAQCFVPYKEVLPIYDAGLQVPPDVTLVWTDDNFSYLRRLSSPSERQRPGGAGIYFHLSYYGQPHSYTWIDTTAPALIWEELHKAWENKAGNLWVINVGDIKPMEIGIDYFSRLAWNPDGLKLGAQKEFLGQFAGENFGAEAAPDIAGLLTQFYRLGTIHKPELMNRSWAESLPEDQAQQLEKDYHELLENEAAVSRTISTEAKDAYEETIGFPVQVLGLTGLIFIADRQAQAGLDVASNTMTISQLKEKLQGLVVYYNTGIAGGKWNLMMPGLVTGKNLPAWSSQVRWPWGEKPAQKSSPTVNSSLKTLTNSPPPGQIWRDAASADGMASTGTIHWSMVEGLGGSGRAVALLPTTPDDFRNPGDKQLPELEYKFNTKAGDFSAYIDFLPTFRIYPGMLLRVTVRVDDGAPLVIEVPGSNGLQNENGPVRSLAVQNNYVRIRVPLPGLADGSHVFKIRALDPGAIIDRVSLP